ncbi:MAG: BlaI/MecI/CopY family transcriptional regulator [Alphaproteobacteria bacterium]|nr:BlaI/MecI/CopY family transcriptional regulator [Alphaproteobacteria bacterium]
MNDTDLLQLSRRERQIMHIVYRLGRATAAQVRDEMDDAPGYSAVRAHLATLERKGHLAHIADGPRYVFHPTVPREDARTSALGKVVSSFFRGSPAKAAVALIEMSDLGEDELDELEALIRKARQEGR